MDELCCLQQKTLCSLAIGVTEKGGALVDNVGIGKHVFWNQAVKFWWAAACKVALLKR